MAAFPCPLQEPKKTQGLGKMSSLPGNPEPEEPETGGGGPHYGSQGLSGSLELVSSLGRE